MLRKPEPRERLRSEIKKRFRTQAHFAFALGADPGFVSRVVNGLHLPCPEKQTQWAAALNRKPAELFQQG